MNTNLDYERVLLLSDCKVGMRPNLETIRYVQVKDKVIEANDLEMTLVAIYTFCSHTVKDAFWNAFNHGEEKVKASIFLGIFFYKIISQRLNGQ